MLLLKSVKGGGSGAPLDLGREVFAVLKSLGFADAEAAWDLGVFGGRGLGRDHALRGARRYDLGALPRFWVGWECVAFLQRVNGEMDGGCMWM